MERDRRSVLNRGGDGALGRRRAQRLVDAQADQRLGLWIHVQHAEVFVQQDQAISHATGDALIAADQVGLMDQPALHVDRAPQVRDQRGERRLLRLAKRRRIAGAHNGDGGEHAVALDQVDRDVVDDALGRQPLAVEDALADLGPLQVVIDVHELALGRRAQQRLQDVVPGIGFGVALQERRVVADFYLEAGLPLHVDPAQQTRLGPEGFDDLAQQNAETLTVEAGVVDLVDVDHACTRHCTARPVHRILAGRKAARAT